MVIRLIKILDIGFITTIYFIFAFIVSTYVDRKILGTFDPVKAQKKTTLRLFAETVFHMYCIGITIYIARNIAEKIPSPFHGIGGFDHFRVKELTNAAVFTFIFIFYQLHLRQKLTYIADRFYQS